jgi:IS4 transposase
MKSYVEIKREGIEFNREFAQEFVREVLKDKGIKEIGSKKYSLWGFPKDNPQIWYIVKGDYRKRVVREITPSLVCKYVSQSLNNFMANEVTENV